MQVQPITERIFFFSAEIFLFSLLVTVALLFHFNGFYGQDSHEYLRICRELNSVIFDGGKLSHTYFPVLYPLFGFAIAQVLRNDIVSMQAISISALVISFHFMQRLLKLIYPETKKILAFSLLFFVASPYIMRFGFLAMSDMLCLMFIVLTTFHRIKSVKQNKNLNTAYAFFFGSGAMATRYAAIVIVIPLLIICVWYILRNRGYHAIIFTIILFSIPLLPDLFLRGRVLFLQFDYGGYFIDYGKNAYAWSPTNFFRSTFLNSDGVQDYHQWNIVYALFNVFHPAFLFAGAPLVLFLRREDFRSKFFFVLLVPLILYIFFLAGLEYQSMRYLLLSFPFVIILLFPAFLRAEKYLIAQKNFLSAALPAVIIVQLFLFIYSSKDIYILNRTERQIALTLKTFPAKRIYTTSIRGALTTYEVQTPVSDLFLTRLDSAEEGALLLFNYSDFSQHFKDLNPMINWEFINQNYRLVPVATFPLGWKLFLVNRRKSESPSFAPA